MHADPYTIRIFVPDGDPEGIRIIERFNWTGKGIVFPRGRWPDVRKRAELGGAGVYILVGDGVDDDDKPQVYIGESDEVGARVDSHAAKKDFWSWGVVFVSTNRALNKAHVQWLEYALVDQARRADRCAVMNANVPKAPDLNESEEADSRGFLREILKILPLVELRAFELPRAVAIPAVEPKPSETDTVIVPAQREGFERQFLGNGQWFAIRIAGGKLDSLKYIAAYQTAPESAVTHYAPIARIESYGNGPKYKLVFAGPAVELPKRIPFADAAPGSMQGPRYTSYKRLLTATKVQDLF
jgi:hypothetical protein